MKQMPKFIMVLAKICEIGAWVLTICLILGLIVLAVNPAILQEPLTEALLAGEQWNINGMDVLITTGGQLNMAALAWTLVCGVITMSLTAMIIRNVYLIMKKVDGTIQFSDANTPFTPDITRMVREIGIFLVAIPLTELVFSWLMNLFLNHTMEISVNLTGLLTGLVIWYLSRIFSYGQQLQSDVDGLV